MSGTQIAINLYMSTLKSNFIIIMTTLLLVVSMEYLFLQNTKFINIINSNLTDSAFLYRGTLPADKRIVIIDVDEKSLKSLGQWPWSRNKIAKILENLNDAGAAIIGLDMVFAEHDSSSPINIAKEANISVDKLADFDKILADTLSQTPTISGFIFNFEDTIKNEPPNSNAMFIQHGKGDEEHLFTAQGITTNIPILQQAAYSSGSFNTLPDSDGIVRYVPLLFAYDDSIYPSLSFEMVRALLGEKKVEIFYDESGVSGIKMGNLEIPTDKQGRLFINYKGGAKSYRYISALDIYNNSFDKKEVEENIILLGTSASGLLDLRATPFESIYPGVEVHANAIDNLINSDIIASPSYIRGLTATAIMVSVLVTALIISFATPLLSFGLIVGFLMIETWYFYDMLFEEHLLPNFAYPLLGTLITTFVLTFMKIYFENRQKMMISEKFAKKVSPQVAAKLLKSSKDAFSVAEVEVTIFFSDIRDFTSISEGFDNPKILIDYLNTYMSPMSQIIIDHEGTIDKYIGDAIMAYWNAPVSVKNHADKAVSAAIKQIEALEKLNETLKLKSYPPIKIGIGLHTGNAIVGEMGSEGRSDYTVIGDSINLGSRIEGLCKPYGAKILISQATKKQLKERYKIREVDRVQVKGKDKAVTIYEVLGFGVFEGSELVTHEHYIRARKLYKEAKFKEAYAKFFKAYELENCKLFALFMDRCVENQKKDLKEVDSIYKYTTK